MMVEIYVHLWRACEHLSIVTAAATFLAKFECGWHEMRDNELIAGFEEPRLQQRLVFVSVKAISKNPFPAARGSPRADSIG